MGLSYPSLSDKTKPVFDRIIETNILTNNIFAFCLGRDPENQVESHFYIGGYDEECIKKGEKIEWHPVVKKSWWTLNL